MKLYFIRHGESEANILREFSNRGLRHGLTEKGRAQATALADQLKSASIAGLFSSPLLRARQTAEILSEALQMPYEVTDALREYDCGVLEGTSTSEGWAIYDRVNQDWLVDHNWESRIEGGESFLDMKARFTPFIEMLLQQRRDSSDIVVLIGHGGLYRCMLPLVLANIDFQFTLTHPISNTGIIIAETGPDGLVCTTWIDEKIA